MCRGGAVVSACCVLHMWRCLCAVLQRDAGCLWGCSCTLRSRLCVCVLHAGVQFIMCIMGLSVLCG